MGNENRKPLTIMTEIMQEQAIEILNYFGEATVNTGGGQRTSDLPVDEQAQPQDAG